MTDVLARICAETRAAVARAKEARPLADVERTAAAAAPPRGFAAALARTQAAGRYALIAEIKQASPSAGMIRPDFDPAALALASQQGGAACLSVLTERANFAGEPAHLVTARAACALPVLRKDFMLEPYQIAEARAIGADCVLLIMAALDNGAALELEGEARRFGMDVLVEVHDRAELERALSLKTRLIGINNRNLKTLKTDIAMTETLAALVPGGSLLVSESGLATPQDLARMARAGARAFLIGEALMRQRDVAAATRALLTPQRAGAEA